MTRTLRPNHLGKADVEDNVLQARQEGIFTVDYSPEANTNILSRSQAFRAGANTSYKIDDDKFVRFLIDKELKFINY